MQLLRRMIGVIAVGLALHSCGPKPLDFTLTFGDAQGLQEGGALVYNGLAIGVVRTLSLDANGTVVVGVRVEGRHRQHVREGAQFAVEAAATGSGDGRPRIVMTLGEAAGNELADGAVVSGQAPATWADRARESGGQFLEFLTALKDSREAQQAGEMLRVLGDSVVAKGKRIDAEDIEAMKTRMEDLARRLERAGKSEEAQEVRRRLAEWLAAVSERLKPEPK